MFIFIPERLEAEVLAAAKTYTPVRRVMASLQRRIDASGCTKWSEHLEAEVSEVVRSFSTDDDSKLRKRTGECGCQEHNNIDCRIN